MLYATGVAPGCSTAHGSGPGHSKTARHSKDQDHSTVSGYGPGKGQTSDKNCRQKAKTFRQSQKTTGAPTKQKRFQLYDLQGYWKCEGSPKPIILVLGSIQQYFQKRCLLKIKNARSVDLGDCLFFLGCLIICYGILGF